jgi:hypothetical protein
MPVYTVRIVYTETLTRFREVPVTANNAEEAETITRRMFRDSQRDPIVTVQVQGKNLGRVDDWEQLPVQKTFVVATMGD